MQPQTNHKLNKKRPNVTKVGSQVRTGARTRPQSFGPGREGLAVRACEALFGLCLWYRATNKPDWTWVRCSSPLLNIDRSVRDHQNNVWITLGAGCPLWWENHTHWPARSFDKVKGWSVRAAPRGPPMAATLLPSFSLSINQYLLTKAPRARLRSLHSYSYFTMLLECTAKCQDLYKVNISPNVTVRVEGRETTFPLAAVFHCQSCELPTLGWEWFLCQRQFHRVICFCRVFNDHIGMGVCILMAACRAWHTGGTAATFNCLKGPLPQIQS